MKQMKKLSALVFALMLLFSSLPVYASEIMDSGTCGDSLTWTLDSNGTLTVSGTGEVYNIPLHIYPQIKTIVLTEGLTNIRNGLFSDCEALSSVVLPASLKKIGNGAFENCSNLKELTIKNTDFKIECYSVVNSRFATVFPSVETLIVNINDDENEEHEIQGSGWNIKNLQITGKAKKIGLTLGNQKLESIIVKEGVEAFRCSCYWGGYFEKLKTISLPKSLKIIDLNVSLSEYYKDNNNWEDGALYCDTVLLMINFRNSETLKIRPGTTVFEENAFMSNDVKTDNGTYLRNIYVPISVISFGSTGYNNEIGYNYNGFTIYYEGSKTQYEKIFQSRKGHENGTGWYASGWDEQLYSGNTIIYNAKDIIPTAILGDVSGDGAVTAEDARFALRAAVGLESYAAGLPEFLAADATKDGAVTAEDARLILRAAVGLETLA